MNPLLILLSIFLLSIFGYNNNPKPVRLEKQLTLRQKIDVWVNKNYYILFFMLIILAWSILAILCYMIIPPMESGVYYRMGV